MFFLKKLFKKWCRAGIYSFLGSNCAKNGAIKKSMFLKKLVLNGFKSFCEISEITFDKGISAIVGPNGCGKSNIVDAIKWVIGEQKTKSLRAVNMTDVIFKGTESRKSLGRTEVKLTIVNEQNILPIEYNEVDITRVIYSNGENEYYLNKQRVRLKDIQELFFDTGVGKSAYSVMEQGKIDLILSNKPEDRRYIIEEAAGITKYKVKREESAGKLAQAEENIIRIKDIIKEVKTQYENMKVQADKAEKYKEYYDKEINLEIELNLNRITKQKTIKNEFNEELDNAVKELNQVKEQVENLSDGIEEKMLHVNELENRKIDSQRDVFQIESDIKILTSKISLVKDQLVNLTANTKSDVEKLKILNDKIDEINGELQRIEESKNELDEKMLGLMKDNDFYNNSIINLDNEIRNAEESIAELKQKVIESNSNLDEKRVSHKKITDQLIETIDKSLNIIEVNANDITRIKSNLKENIELIRNELPQRRAFIDDILKAGFISTESKEILKMLAELSEKLKGIEDKIVIVDDNTKKYINITEIFLDDIFKPEGILQQKRSVESEINEINENIKKFNTSMENLQSEIITKKDKKEEYREILTELRTNLTIIKEQKISIDKEVARIVSLKNNYETNRDELAQKIKFSENKIKEIRNAIDEHEKKLVQDQKTRDSLEKKLKNIDQEIQKENMKVSQQNKYIREINTRLTTKQSAVERLNVKIAECETTIKNLYDGFYENYSINLSEYESKGGYITNRNYDEVRSQLAEIRAEKHSLGNVNLMAIEECKSLSERYKLLTEQLDDLEKAKKDIVLMMDEINKVSIELFLKTFDQIKVNFHKIFRKLFDGGNAEINLTNPDNVLESGIDIIAHPPGQKTQSIMLLSGGQRTMTAISLMFATFLVKPSPFCILDEIDAALDEENVTRFISLLGEFKETSQFIMITHNKKTISASDVMYGITQEEKGVSKIVSAKFVEKV
jgi:chromosome segregation protein